MSQNEEKSSENNDQSSDSDIYKVDKILKKKVKNGKATYKVQWEGFPLDQCTWEPSENLENVQDMLDEFNQKQQTESQSKMKKSIKKPRKKYEKRKLPQPQNEKNPSDNNAPKKVQKKNVQQLSTEINKKKPTKEILNIPHFGHYEFGDKPLKIAFAKQDSTKGIILMIEWEKRENGDTPTPTIMTNQELRKYDADFLLDFYESRITFNFKSQEEKQKNKNKQLIQRQNLLQNQLKQIRQDSMFEEEPDNLNMFFNDQNVQEQQKYPDQKGVSANDTKFDNEKGQNSGLNGVKVQRNSENIDEQQGT